MCNFRPLKIESDLEIGNQCILAQLPDSFTYYAVPFFVCCYLYTFIIYPMNKSKLKQYKFAISFMPLFSQYHKQAATQYMNEVKRLAKDVEEMRRSVAKEEGEKNLRYPVDYIFLI